MEKYLHIDKIGDRLKQYRLAKGHNVIDFSKILGISQGSLSGLENNKSKPSADTLANLVLYTDIDIKWLLTGETGIKGLSSGYVVQYEHPIEAQHMKLIKEFKNKELAKNINSKLIELEQIDPDELEDVDDYLDHRISRKKQKKVDTTWSGTDRRKNKAG